MAYLAPVNWGPVFGKILGFSAGADGEAVGPVVVVQRVDVAAVEVQVAGVGLAVRGVGPVVAVSTDIVQRAGVVGPVTRSASVGEWPVC